MRKLIFCLGVITLCGGCSDNKFADLKEFMRAADESARSIRIDEPPAFEAYQPFSYTGANRRSPFHKPDSIEDSLRKLASANVFPDEDRPKEFLEGFDIANLKYVGLISQGSSVWALIRDPQGKIHRIKSGNHLGKDNGKVKTITEQQLIVLEIVPNGINSWIERPYNMHLQGHET